jgi:hypothetical protein
MDVDVDTETVRTHFSDLLTIAEIARNLNDFRPLDETMELICERVAGMPACDWVTISLVSDLGDTTKSWGDRHIKPEFMSWARSQNDVEKSLKSPVFHAIASGRPVLIADVTERNDLPALRAAASVQGIRAMAYLPIMTRGKALGTMNCYTSTPHRHTDAEIDLLQTVARLAGVAAETALIADRQRATSEHLQLMTRELSDRNLELSSLSEAQVRLTEGMTETYGDAVQRLVDGLAAETGAAATVVTSDGRPRAFSGPEDGQRVIAAMMEKRDFAKLPSDNPSWTLDDCDVVRIGTSRTLGLLLVHPGSSHVGSSSLVLLRHAAAILAVEFEVENSDRTLRDLARPNALLAVARGELSQAQAQAMSPVLGATGEPVRVLINEVQDDTTASKVADALNRAPRGWGFRVSAAEGSRVMSLVLDSAAASLESRIVELFAERHLGAWKGGLSPLFRDVTALPDAVRSATSALRIADPAGRLVAFDDLGRAADLLDAIGRDRAMQFVEETIGPVIAYDTKRSTDLLPSLASYLKYRGSLRQAAEALNVHPNTLQLRLARITQLTKIDLHDPEELGLIAMALAWRRLA